MKKASGNHHGCFQGHKTHEKGFRLACQESLLFLPETFRDCGVLVCSNAQYVNKVLATKNDSAFTFLWSGVKNEPLQARTMGWVAQHK